MSISLSLFLSMYIFIYVHIYLKASPLPPAFPTVINLTG